MQDSLVSDHHAIIPTEQRVNMSALSADETKLFNLIAMRFLEVLSPSYKYKTTTATIDVEGKLFKTRLSTPVEQGYRNVSIALNIRSAAPLTDEGEAAFAILRLKEGDKVKVEKIKVRQQATTPPERYTEASLLSAMEHAGRFVEDKSLKGNLTNGLGTPATRAEIIEKLIQNNYISREGKYLVPSEKGRELVRLAPKVLSSPELTGEWEGRLEAISKGKEDPSLFIKDIKAMAVRLVDEVKNSSLVFSPTFKEAKECPWCHGPMMKVVDETGCVHHICQRLSCSYEEKEVKVRVEGPSSSQGTKSVTGPDGKVKVVLKKAGAKVPKAAYVTKTEVVKESKLSYKKERVDKKFSTSSRHSSSYSSSSDGGGGTFADFLKQAQERNERRGKRK